MKYPKILLASLLCLFITSALSAQVNSFSFEGVKDYPEGNRIAYFQIDGLQSEKEEAIVQTNLRANSNIYRFYVYSQKNGVNRCMIDCDSSVDEADLKTLINQALISNKKE